MSEVVAKQGKTPVGSDSAALTCKVFRHGRPGGDLIHLDRISEILEEGNSLVWLDVIDPGPHDLDVLQDEFSLHPLAIEDAVQAHQRPKIEEYEGYYFLDVQAVTIEGGALRFHEIAIFAGANFLVTVRHQPAFAIDEVEERWKAHPEQLRRGGGFLLYTILDTVVDGYFPVVEAFETEVDGVENRLLGSRHLSDREVLLQIFSMKRDAQQFRHAALPMRDILAPIIRGDLHLFGEDEIVYYRDVYDHAVRVVDQLDSMRDLIQSALDIHLSMVANRQGEVTKQLTVIATIFLPLSFIVGFFGQNFGVLVDHISSGPSFWFLGIGSELLAVSIMLAYFKRKHWF